MSRWSRLISFSSPLWLSSVAAIALTVLGIYEGLGSIFSVLSLAVGG
jgi:hypothetical protein